MSFPGFGDQRRTLQTFNTNIQRVTSEGTHIRYNHAKKGEFQWILNHNTLKT